MKPNKTNWIDAYKITLNEYKKGTHKCNDSCAKCKMVTTRLTSGGHHRNCNLCIERVFQIPSLYCLGRNNRPTEYPNERRKAGLIEYHKQAIKFLKSLPAKDFMNNDFSKLVEIDKSINT